eukprot:SAG31_NODE_29106_length_400_cov_1.481728_1_plen_42_part_10
MSLVTTPIISLVVECDSNNEVGGDNYDPNWEQISAVFCEIVE